MRKENFVLQISLYIRRDNAVIEYSFLYYLPIYFYGEESRILRSALPEKSVFSVPFRLCKVCPWCSFPSVLFQMSHSRTVFFLSLFSDVFP